MEFIKPIIGHLCDGIISVKKFPDIIRNGMHHAELSVFDKTDVVYNQDISQTVTGGSRSREPKTLLGLNIVNDFTRENMEHLNESLKVLSKFDRRANIEIIKTPIEEYIKREKIDIIINKIPTYNHRKTRKRSRSRY